MFCATVTHFDRVSVKYLVELVRLREVQISQVAVSLNKKGGDIPAKQWVEPDHTLATVSFLLSLFCFNELQFGLMITAIFSAVSYLYFYLLKISSLYEFLISHSLIDINNYLISWGGWLQNLFIYNNELLGIS